MAMLKVLQFRYRRPPGRTMVRTAAALAAVLSCACGALAAEPAPSASWSFDGTAGGLTPVAHPAG